MNTPHNHKWIRIEYCLECSGIRPTPRAPENPLPGGRNYIWDEAEGKVVVMEPHLE